MSVYVMTPAGLAASHDAPPYAVAGSNEMEQLLLGGFCERSRTPTSVDDIVVQYSESAARGMRDTLAGARADVPSGVPCHLRIAACAQAYVDLALERGFIRAMGADEERDASPLGKNPPDVEELGRTLLAFARAYGVTMDTDEAALAEAILGHVRDRDLATAADVLAL